MSRIAGRCASSIVRPAPATAIFRRSSVSSVSRRPERPPIENMIVGERAAIDSGGAQTFRVLRTDAIIDRLVFGRLAARHARFEIDDARVGRVRFEARRARRPRYRKDRPAAESARTPLRPSEHIPAPTKHIPHRASAGRATEGSDRRLGRSSRRRTGKVGRPAPRRAAAARRRSYRGRKILFVVAGDQ